MLEIFGLANADLGDAFVFHGVAAMLVVTYFGAYALRGLYFALLEQTRVPYTVTGAAVGLISLIGYTPDIFVGPIAGRLLDNYPGVTGYQYFYLLLGVVSVVGLVTAATISRGASRGVPAAVTPS